MKSIIKIGSIYPWRVITALLVISFIAFSQLDNIRINISAESMLEKGTPAWNHFVSTEKTFGGEDVAIIVLRDSNIFSDQNLIAIQSTIKRIEELPFVSRTSSLFNTSNLKNIDGFIHTAPYLDGKLLGEDGAGQVKSDAIRNPLALGNLISKDGQTIAINVFLEARDDDPDLAQAVTQALETAIAPLRLQLSSAYQVGLSAITHELTGKLLLDQQFLLPLSVLVLLLTLAITLRRATAALMPLITAGLSVFWLLGFMAWMEIPINIMTSIVPALIVIIGSTEDIHLLAEYLAGTDAGQSEQAAMNSMADKMGVAVLLTFITTYCGFLSIAVNNIELLYQFGLVSSSGLLFNFLITVLLVPAMLRLFGPRSRRKSASKSKGNLAQRISIKMLNTARKHRVTVFVLATVVALGAFASATQIRINNNLLDYLGSGSEVRANAERIHSELAGIHSFSIVVDGRIDGTFLQVKYLEEIQKIQAFLAKQELFDRSFSFADFIAVVNSVMAEDSEDILELPESDDIVREYILFIKERDIASYVATNFDRARILVRHNIASSEILNRGVSELRNFIHQNVDPALQVTITGKSILSNQAVEEMAYDQLKSLLLVAVVIFLLISMLFVSFRAGMISLIPNLFPILILFGTMGVLEIPLNAGTSMVAAIALGICIDDTTHVMSRFHEELKRNHSREMALAAMVRSEATPIFSTSLALAAGFAIFAMSSFEPVVYFGLLSALVILVALLATLVLTPLLLGTSQLLTVWDLLSYKIQNEAVRRSPLFQGMYIWQVKKLLLASEIRDFSSGDQIIKEGDQGSEIYLLLEGAVEARKAAKDGSKIALRVMRVGDMFGEVGPLSGGRRTADVFAVGDSRLLVLSWERIDSLTRIYPILAFRLFRNLTQIVGERLTRTREYRVDAAGNAISDNPSGPLKKIADQ